MVFLKKIALEYDLSCIVGKDHVSFPNKMILHLRRKMKGDLSQKKYTKIWHFIQIFWKDGLFKKGRRWDMIFLVLSGKMVFFPWKHDIFPLGRKWEMTFLKKYMEIWYFLCTRTGVTNIVSRPSPKKKKRNQRWSYPAKIHLKVIEVLDWHPRKSSSNYLYFHGDDLYIVQTFSCR